MSDIEYLMKHRPHVVILGAGSSCAAIHAGDKYGRRISTMNGFIRELGLQDIIDKVNIQTPSNNLEEIYMEIDNRSKNEPLCLEVKDELERKIYEYISEYCLPDSPTIYDFLLLSLTKKDFIATFNWDPLLPQAYRRVSHITSNLPGMAFLHGNVAAGYCEKDNIVGPVGSTCKCGLLLEPMKLLYPIKSKDYNSDIAISKFWKTLGNALEVAYMVTIFGYSAPKSDAAAVEMMLQAWGKWQDREFEEIEIIDIRDESEVLNSWDGFIHTHHYSYHNSFFDSSLGRFPRRSCETIFDMTMNVRWVDGEKGYKENMAFEDIKQFVQPLLLEEDLKRGTKDNLNNPYS